MDVKQQNDIAAHLRIIREEKGKNLKRKTQEAAIWLTVLSLFLSSGAGIKPTGASSTLIKVDPSLLEYESNAVGEEFTVAINIIDVVNLYGFDIRFRWNTTFFEYVSHSIRVPRDTYPDGVLWKRQDSPQILEVKNEVNTTAGTYWIAYSSVTPAPSFNGSGTVFAITLRVIHHPQDPEPTAETALQLYSTQLVDRSATPITHAVQHGTVILYTISTVTRMYIDPRKKVSDVSGEYQSRPTSYTTTGVAQPYYFHGETTTINGENYYLLIPKSADAAGLNLAASMASTGRILWGKTAYPLEGVSSISPATWTFYYRTWYDSPLGGTAHADVDILVRKSDGTIRATIATDVASSTSLTDSPTTRSGSYAFSNYAVVGQTDCLEVDYYLHVTTAADKNAYIRIEDTTLSTLAQTRVASPTMLPYIMNPGNAFDGNDATYASFLTNADGNIDFKTFNTTLLGTEIAQVDLKIRYQTLRVTGGDDRFRINQTVTPSTVYSNLRGWTTSDVEVPIGTYVWSYLTEANDGIWSWTDLSNTVVRFQSDVVGTGENREIRIYEVWAEVYDKPFTVNLRAELVEDLYNSSARITWNPAIIELTSLSKGPFLTGPEGTIFSSQVNRTSGYAYLSEQVVGEYQGVTGAGNLAKLTFKVLREGKSSITLSETLFLTSALEPMEHRADSGSFNTPAYHDIAITDIIVVQTKVYQEEAFLFNVVAKNKGTYAESFTVYFYANESLVDLVTITDLVGGAETLLSPEWNTTGYIRGNYTLKAATSTIEGDYAPENNTLAYSSIRVKMLGDIDDNGQVDTRDLHQLGKAFGSTEGPPADPNWNANADLNGDTTVNSLDLSALNRKYGKTS
jgi:hypothetical protein